MATGFDKFLSKPLPTTVKPTEHGLRTIIRRWEISAEALRVANADTNAFPAYETPDEEYTSALLVEQSTGDGTAFGVKLMYWRVYQELPANTTDLVQLGKTVFSTTESGLQTAEQRFVARAGHVLTGDVGTDTGGAGTDVEGLYLAGRGFAERGRVSAVVVKRWAEPGILDATHEFGEDGLLYVTFVSQGTKFRPTALAAEKSVDDPEDEAFQGGAEADLFRSRTRNVNGFRRFTVTVMLLPDGSALNGESDNLLWEYQDWADYQKPGLFSLGAGSISTQPGLSKSVKVTVQIYLSKSGNISDGFKPYSVDRWAGYTYYYVPSETGIPVQKSGSANGYLGNSSFAASGGQVFGVDVDAASGSSSSDPGFDDFMHLQDQVIRGRNRPAFITDEGVRWYRKRRVTVVGRFGEFLVKDYTPPV